MKCCKSDILYFLYPVSLVLLSLFQLHLCSHQAFDANNYHFLQSGVSRFEYIRPTTIQIETYHIQDLSNHTVLLSFQAYNRVFSFRLAPSTLLHPEATVSRFQNSSQFETTSLHDELVIYEGFCIHDPLHQNRNHLNLHLDNVKKRDNVILKETFHARFVFHISRENMFNFNGVWNSSNSPIFEGSFRWNGEDYSVVPIEKYYFQKRDVDVHVPFQEARSDLRDQASQLMIYRTYNDRLTETHFNFTPKCGNEAHVHSFEKELSINNFRVLTKRSISEFCPTSKLVAYVAVVADCTYIKRSGGEKNARIQILHNFLKVTQLYEATFNIQIGIVSITLFKNCGDPRFNQNCDENYNLSNRLEEFSQWINSQSVTAHLWHLFTECSYGNSIGLAWTGGLCTNHRNPSSINFAAGISAPSKNMPVDSEWIISAHEIGHNFGGVHDCVPGNCTDCCPCSENKCDSCQRRFIMNPGSHSDQPAFSPCSKTKICENFVGRSCLTERGDTKVITIAQCGNGIVEDGEECDCGDSCPSDCCQIDCKLKPNAQCDDLSDSCCTQCKIAEKTKLCRQSRGECDIPEYCTGTSKSCPVDVRVENGTTCNIRNEFLPLVPKSSGTCTEGYCTTRELQCILHTSSHVGSFTKTRGECPVWYRNQCAAYCKHNDDECYNDNFYFLDGTPCGIDGLCKGGLCDDKNFFGKMMHWAIANPYWTILILICISIFVVVLIYFIMWMFRGYK